MDGGNQKKRTRVTESGYALILMLFFLALLVLSMAVASPTISNSITREREAEMIWRGKQYARGIRLYYVKMKRLPGSVDDLTKRSTAGMRFMRQAYKDPMNEVDGSWRLIFLGPNGQLLGNPSSTNDPNQPQTLAGPTDSGNTVGGSLVGVESKVDRKSLIVYEGMRNYKDFRFVSDRLTSMGTTPASAGTSAQNATGASPGAAAAGGAPGVPASTAGDWVNQMLPGPGITPQPPQMPTFPTPSQNPTSPQN
jgi:hypothetical protein